MVAFWAHNPLVVGSIPIPATLKTYCDVTEVGHQIGPHNPT